MDFNRIGKLIKQTKDKLIVATDADLLVVMDLDSYEELIRESQTKTQFVAKDVLKNPINTVVDSQEELITPKIKEEESAISFEEKIKNSPAQSSLPAGQAGPISVKDVIADKAEQTFAPPTGDFNQVDEADEFYFEEVDE